MKKSNNENVEYLSENIDSDVYQHEDAVLKTSMQFFAEELLPYLGIEGEVVSFAPTELVHLELKKLFQDFNFVMSDGRWLHFEFQSENEGLKGLKRFRVYESMASYQHNVCVTTYVLYSGKIKNPMTEFTEGLKEEIKMTRLGQMLINDGFAQGHSQGLSQGLSRGKIESILELLEDLGEVPKELRTKILEEKDMQVLNGWLKLAAKSDSIDEFEEKCSVV